MAEAYSTDFDHPGFVAAWGNADTNQQDGTTERSRMPVTDRDIIHRIAAGELPSPQAFCGSVYFCMRFTGTGFAFRPKNGELAYRDPAVWLADEMADRIRGCPIVVEHPVEGIVTADVELVGTVVFGFVRGDELWCVARFPRNKVDGLGLSGAYDTSPSAIVVTAKLNHEGDIIAVEGSPTAIDHLALIFQGNGNSGVWSQKSDDPAVEVAA
jgi:hypothetical protein